MMRATPSPTCVMQKLLRNKNMVLASPFYRYVKRKPINNRYGSMFVEGFVSPATQVLPVFERSQRKNKIGMSSEKSIKFHPVGNNGRRITTIAESDLVSNLRNAYEQAETDGVLLLAQELLSNHSAEDLFSASLEAASYNKGRAMGIFNALLGGCASRVRPNPKMASCLLEVLDRESDSIEIFPDIVTYCNTYCALLRGGPEYKMSAVDVLERVKKVSKKLAGSKRRRALAASRRRFGSDSDSERSMQDFETSLQDIYGIDFRVLHETDELVVINKPSGMVCFHKHKTTAGKIRKKRKNKKNATTEGNDNHDRPDVSLEDSILDFGIPLSTLNSEGRGIVHRLDRGTSGCIVLAKNDETHAQLVTDFFTREVKKSYLALTSPSENYDETLQDTGEITLEVGGRPAVSKYEIVKRYGSSGTLIQLETFTGRKHQVRVHCAQGLGQPIMLDPLYTDALKRPCKNSTGKDNNKDGGDKFFLHASTLNIPSFGVKSEAPLPLWWEETINSLKQ